jgi:hypothetical protein
MRRIQWNINAKLNKIFTNKNFLKIMPRKSIHSEIKVQTTVANNASNKAELKINKVEILKKLNLINQNFEENEFPSFMVNKAIEINFPIYPKYVRYLLNSLLKSNNHFIIDYKYCHGVLMNTFMLYMISSLNTSNINEKKSINNIILYVIKSIILYF